MSLTLFKGALGDVGLLAKTRTALGASSDEAWCRQTISGLQLLETVLSQMKNLSPTIATEETRRIVELCRLACAPILENFMQELERLEPDLDRYFVAGEDNPDVESPPLWATTVERNMTTLMRGIGMQLQLVNALFQVESLQDRTANGETQQISRTPPDPVSLKPATTTSSQQFIVTGNENAYQGIQIGGSARAHIGNSYSYIGVPKASVDKLSESLNDLATSRQADGLLSLLQGIRKKQSDGCNALTILDARTQQVLEQLGQVAEGSRAMLALFQKSSPPNMASAEQLRSLGSRASEHSSKSNVPTKAHSGQQYGKLPKDQDANQLTNMALVLEIIRIWLSTMIMMLLMGSRSIQSFIRSARTITRSPSMLLESNIKIFDVLNRELSLPYEHFRYWPVVLARLQCEFKGFPGESHIMRKKFGLFRAAKRFRNESIISFDDWESSVSPGDQVLMSIDVEQFDPDKCPSCGCALREMHLSPGFSKWFVFLASFRAIINTDLLCEASHVVNLYSPCATIRPTRCSGLLEHTDRTNKTLLRRRLLRYWTYGGLLAFMAEIEHWLPEIPLFWI